MVKTPEKGLSEQEARRLLLQNGENILSKGKKNSVMKIFAGQFRDAMVMILLAATVVSALLGELHEAAAIVTIVLLNALLGFFQEWRCEKTLEALSKMSAPTARVRRDGREYDIAASQVVKGDILIISAGDCIAADAVILTQNSLSCDEAMLTGESEPVLKCASADERTPQKTEMVFMGTHAVSGRAEVRVTATGMTTEMGKIADMLGEIEEQQTPLQQRLDQVGKAIGTGCLLICAAVAAVGVLRGENALDMLITGISLAVAAVPEGLPAIVTVSLALAVRKILRKNALVKRLHAVETLGCATVICSDKTGTLTQNKMTVSKASTVYRDYDINSDILSGDEGQSMLFRAAAFCNDSKPQAAERGIWRLKREQQPRFLGDPTETALAKAAADMGVRAGDFYRKGEIPFDSDRKRMTVWGSCNDGVDRTFMKGAPEVVLAHCEKVLTQRGAVPLTGEHKKLIAEKNSEFASAAFRVLGFAYKDGADSGEKGMTFIGLIGLFDPPREEAAAAISECKSAKIRTVMITGDHAATAAAVARQLGINEKNVVTGEQIERMSERQLCEICKTVSVFARVAPEHKLRIVRAMKQNGEITAMTGDGVNDAPAVKEANIGVAMGENGTDVTREAADVILLDDNFATLVAAVREGRVIYQNIRRFLRYLLSCNAGEVITMFGGMLMGMPVILTPIQLLLVNLITDGLPAIALGLEPADDMVMRRPPRASDDSIFANGLLGKIIFRGILIGLTTLGIFSIFYTSGSSLAQARTAALLTLTMSQLFHVFECRSERGGIFGANLFSNPFLLFSVAASFVFVLAAVYNNMLCDVFMTVSLNKGEMLRVIAASAAIPVISSAVSFFEKK